METTITLPYDALCAGCGYLVYAGHKVKHIQGAGVFHTCCSTSTRPAEPLPEPATPWWCDGKDWVTQIDPDDPDADVKYERISSDWRQ